MLRESSEMAVAISVSSVPEKPMDTAISRPRLRAVTMSCSAWMGTQTSSGMRTPVAGAIAAAQGAVAEKLQGLFQVQRGGHAVQLQAQLGHGEGHLRLDAHDHRAGAPQAQHLHQFAQG